jgi:hypothetical protein
MPNAVTVPSPRMAVTYECRAKLIFGFVLGAQGMVREAREWWWSAVRGAVPRVAVGPCRAEPGRFLYVAVAGTCFALAGPDADLALTAKATAAKRVTVTMDGRRGAGETERRGQRPDGGHRYGQAGLRRDEEGSDAFAVTFMIDHAGELSESAHEDQACFEAADHGPGAEEEVGGQAGRPSRPGAQWWVTRRPRRPLSSPPRRASSLPSHPTGRTCRAGRYSVMRRLQSGPAFRDLAVNEYQVLFTLARCLSGRLRLNELNVNVLLSQSSLCRLNMCWLLTEAAPFGERCRSATKMLYTSMHPAAES